jgi:tripartite-type tricarboxylate transporter receptor subunit TctC
MASIDLKSLDYRRRLGRHHQQMTGATMIALLRAAALSLICLASLAGAAAPASAGDYPNRPVRWLIGFAAGGPVDIVARIMSQWLSDHFGQQFVVENRAGSGGNLAAAAAINAPADGYTLLFVAPNNAISTSLYKKLPYDFMRDTVPVASIMQLTNMLVVSNSLPVKTVQEFIDYCKANPGKVSYASSGYGTSVHMSGELFKAMTKVDIVHVPYRGSAIAFPDIISNKVQLIFDNLPSALEQARGGSVRALRHLAAALARRTRRAGHCRDRARLRIRRLLRHLRRQGHAAGNRRDAQQGGRRGAEGSKAGGAACRDRRHPETDDAGRIRQAARRRNREMAQGGRVRRRFGGVRRGDGAAACNRGCRP